MNMLKTAFLSCALGLGAMAASADTTLRIGTMVPATSLQGQATDRFAEMANAAGVGLDIRIFPASQLGGGDVQMQNVKQGIQDGIIEDQNWLSTFSDTLRITSTPFLFRDMDHMAKWIASPAFDGVRDDLLTQGNQVVYFGDELWLRGPYRVLIGTRPVTNLQELSAVRLRMYANEIVQRFWGRDGFGANTITVAWSEVYLALSQGTVDVLTAPMDQVIPMRFAEVAKHITRTDEAPQFLGLSINADKWNALTDEQKAAIQTAWDAAGKELNAALAADAAGWIDELRAQGVTVHEFARDEFVARSAEIADALIAEGKWDAEVIQGIRDIE